MKKYIFFLLILFVFTLGQSVAQIKGNWKPIGPSLFPTNVSGQVNGIGRVCQVKFHPSDPQKMYAVSASGGLWISNNGAATWQRTGTDSMPYTACASVCIDHTNDQVMYLGTGDANYYDLGFFGNLGIWKSTDGGQRWNKCNTGNNILAVEILMHPANNNELIAATNLGIWKTYDGGETWWIPKEGGNFKDMIFKPVPGSATIYAVTDNEFFRSTDMGETWTSVPLPGTGITGGGRLAVSKANPEIVYLTFVGNFGNGTATPVLRSTNSGQSFTIMKSAGHPNLNGMQPSESGQGNYNYGMTADPNNADMVYIVGHVVWKSTNGGMTWSQLTNWWETVHTDMHDIEFSPYDGTKLFNANDGGVWLSTNGGSNWQPKSHGLEVTECYHAGQSPLRKDINYIGTQDNGELYFKSNAWFTNRAGDWRSKMVLDYQNATMAYYLDDGYRRSFNQDFQGWAMPESSNSQLEQLALEFTPLQKQVAFFSKTDIWRTTNLSSNPPTWTKIGKIGNWIKALASSPADANILYAYTQDGRFLRSDNALSASPSFATASTLPVPAFTIDRVSITGIKNNPDVVYVTAADKVFRSDNKGVRWTDVSAGLPTHYLNIFKIHHDIHSDDESVYVGMATGVYYKNNTMSEWVNYSKGLPTIANITDFMIFNDGTSNSVLRVSYYGRGVWESPLQRLRDPENPPAVNGLDFSYYEGNWDLLPPFNTLTPVKTGSTQSFDLSPRNTSDNFAFKFTGYIDIPADGQYTFYTTSNEGSQLFIGDNLVVDNDGLHEPTERSGTIGLKAGKHAITVTYFEKSGSELLQVSYAGPGMSKQQVAHAALFKPASCDGAGTITREQWRNVGGDRVSDIPVGAIPSSTGSMTLFEATPDIGNAYGSRVRGYVCPPSSGDYIFWIASDNASELWLSTNDDPANKVKLATVVSGVAPRSWDEQATQMSVPVHLAAGQKYYIEALHKERDGGDHLAVGWQMPTGESERPIPGNRLLPFVTPLTLKEHDNPVSAISALDYRYYEGQWTTLPDLSQITPVGTGVVPAFSIAPRKRENNFALEFRGYIDVPADGEYIFYTSSNGGSKLWIGAKNLLVVSNDGLHALQERSGKIGLKKGKHIITVAFFAGNEAGSLDVGFEGPSIPKQSISASRLWRLRPPAVAPCIGSGGITREQWNNVEGSKVSDIPVGAIQSSVAGYGMLKFEAVPNIGDAYGSRVRGYICPPYTGDYSFWIASDDASELWLSTNDDPANKVKLAAVSNYVAPRSWNEQATQKSAPVYLVAGQKYYVEALQKDYGGDDHLAVAWQLPTGELEQPIPGNRLLPFFTPLTLKEPDNPVSTLSGLEYRYYEDEMAALSLASLTPVSTGAVPTFSIAPRHRDNNFGFEFRGYIDVPDDGEYTFYTNSNSGSRLWIGANNMLVINNDGLHTLQERSGKIGLKKGKHIIAVGFFAGHGAASLEVSFEGPSIPKQIIPASRLFRLDANAVSCTGTGLIYREIWGDVEGSKVSDIPVAAAANVIYEMLEFEAAPYDVDAYGSRVSGYICPPYTGNYTFWIASDGESELWLSTNNNPANKIKLAAVASRVAPRDWDAQAGQKSVPVHLVAGQKYYVEALHKNVNANDHLAVGWQLPTGELQRPIPGNRLLPFGGLITFKEPDDTNNREAGLDYRYYEGQWTSLPAFASMTPLRTGMVPTFSIAPRSSDDNFGFVLRGYIDVPAFGEYIFYLNADNGSKLWIGADNKLLINNDGLNVGGRPAQIWLKPGKHILTVAYFEATGGESLAVSVEGPGIPQQIIPASMLFRLPASVAPVVPAMKTDELDESALINYPNPFTVTTTIEFSLKEKGRVSLTVFDNQGNKVSELYNGNLNQGAHSFKFDAADLPAGNYIGKLVTKDKSRTIKMLKVSRPANKR